MTNREKAEEIMPLIQNMELICEDTRLRLVKMAKWKDEQTKAEIDKMISEQNQNGTAMDDVLLGALKSLKQRLNLE